MLWLTVYVLATLATIFSRPTDCIMMYDYAHNLRTEKLEDAVLGIGALASSTRDRTPPWPPLLDMVILVGL